MPLLHLESLLMSKVPTLLLMPLSGFFVQGQSGMGIFEGKKRKEEIMIKKNAYRIVCLREELLGLWRYPIRRVRIVLFQRCICGRDR